MRQVSEGIFYQLSARGPFARSLLLSVVLVACYLLAAPLVWLCGGMPAVTAATVAVLFCLIGGVAALIAGQFFRGLFPGGDGALYQLLVGMMLRMGIPLGLCLVFWQRGGVLVEAGLLYYVIPFYLVMLLVETGLAVGQMQATETSTEA